MFLIALEHVSMRVIVLAHVHMCTLCEWVGGDSVAVGGLGRLVQLEELLRALFEIPVPG